jgi:hypothetical protein
MIAKFSRWSWHVSTYKTVEPIIRQCSTVRHLGIFGYKTLSYILINSVSNVAQVIDVGCCAVAYSSRHALSIRYHRVDHEAPYIYISF